MHEIDSFVSAHTAWIHAKRELILRRIEFESYHFSSEENVLRLRRLAECVLREKTAYWAKVMGVRPTGVKITAAKKRFGSCSADNSIAYSFRLMAYDAHVVDYVVVHELAHIRHKNHSPSFYSFVAQYIPDYKQCQRQLRYPQL